MFNIKVYIFDLNFIVVYLTFCIMKYFSFAAFVAILLLVLFPSCKQMGDLFGGKKKAQAAAAIAMQQARMDSARVADSLKRAQDALVALEMANQESARLAEEAARLASKYHIIVGSFYTSEYAVSWANEYRQQGYNVQIVQMRGSRFELVSAESFSNFRSAFNRLLEIQEYTMPDAWIYINE